FLTRRPPLPTLFPYTTLFRSDPRHVGAQRKLALKLGATQVVVLSVIGAGLGTVLGFAPLAMVYVTLAAAAGSTLLVVSLLQQRQDRKSTRLNSSHVKISYAVF